MARRCEVCNKGVVSGTQYSHSHRQSKRTWAPNIKRVKALVNGTPKTVHVCTRCLRSGKYMKIVAIKLPKFLSSIIKFFTRKK